MRLKMFIPVEGLDSLLQNHLVSNKELRDTDTWKTSPDFECECVFLCFNSKAWSVKFLAGRESTWIFCSSTLKYDEHNSSATHWMRWVDTHTHTHTHTHTLLSHLFQMIRLHNKDSIQIQRKVASEHLKVRSETFACWFVSNKLKRYFLRRFGVLSLCSAAEISALLSDIDDWPSASLFVEHQHVFLMLTPVAVSRCSHSPLSSAAGHIRLKIENRLQGFVKVCTKITGASLNDFPYLCEDTSQIILDDPSRPPSKAFSASIWQQDALMCITLRTLAWYFYFEREPEVKV